MKKKRGIEQSGLSFMDVICCGFGAIVLLLVITKIIKPSDVATIEQTKSASVTALQQELAAIDNSRARIRKKLPIAEQQNQITARELAALQKALEQTKNALRNSKQQLKINQTLAAKSEAASATLKQSLASLPTEHTEAKNQIAGIPLDGEYIIFIIDTSGSMRGGAWDLMVKTMQQILDVYAKVKGIQIMSDMGEYLYTTYKGSWIPDTPARRTAIIRRLRSWDTFSNSSPVEGIEQAISTYYKQNTNTAIYILGDELAGGSIEEVLDIVDKLNGGSKPRQERIRIHAIGFPVQFYSKVPSVTGVRFATLMRELTHRNKGAFVGLPSSR